MGSATRPRQTAQRVGNVVQEHFGGAALTLTIQDGPEAGQTVPHVHIHVLPRRAGDFEPNDKVYDAIDESEASLAKKNLDEERPQRSREDMFAEAATLRALFDSA